MLVLTRRVNETIMIGDDICVRIVAVQGHGPHAQVRIGITAPKETPVLRREIYDQVHRDDGAGLVVAAEPGESAPAAPGAIPPGATGGILAQ